MNKEFNTTHYGLMFGIVPVNLDMTDEYCPSIEARGGFLGEAFLDIAEVMFGIVIFIYSAINPDYEPSFPIKITGEKK